ncbi:MAG: ATP-dependent DNA helicase RecG, partial [Bacteroidetes bacterium]|nr:ATP-dependent DNA helicase RecG [Candidatus Cryptobacteroides excrementavium]
LIRLYPFRYVDRSAIIPIAGIVPDMAYIQIRARVVSRELIGASGPVFMDGDTEKKSGQRTGEIKFNTVRRMSVLVQDSSGYLGLVFFKGIKWMYGKLEPGKEFIFFGKPSMFNGRVNMVHPEVDEAPPERTGGNMGGDRDDMSAGTMTGIYTGTEKLRNGGITGKVMLRLQAAALNACLIDVRESLPEYILKERKLVPIHYALRNIHFPAGQEALAKARRRLKFEELFYLQLSLLKQKYIRSREEHGIKMPKVGEAFNLCYNALPFPLTGAQKRVITEIRNDMKSGHQMNRLLQGDVGSGKTMVAVLTALIAIGNGYQACIMAPTEVLAQQHFKNISKYLAPAGVKVALLTGSSRTQERREIHSGLEDGSIGIIVGTHALLEDNVVFRNLGLAIIDEQHRFGVEQRASLWKKSACGMPPHVLVMTATPIPRTLAMTLYGDLDVSVIDELPPGRKPVQTIHATESKRPAVFRFMKDQIALGRQIFVVYPLIFESEKMDYRNLEQGYEQIVQAFPFPPYKTAIVHGQQTNDCKNFNMDAFAAGRADILVATSVIEVGVDVPNASVMVIESAERFGLSQLHQLRGRVGRGSEKSYCILMTGHRLSKESKHRIDLMCATENGFELAEEDMKMRGPGDLEGTQQSGLPISLNIASLAKDGLMLNEARQCAEEVLKADPALSSDRNAILREELRKDKYRIRDYSKIS